MGEVKAVVTVTKSDTMNPGWETLVRFLEHGGCVVERESFELVAFSVTFPTPAPDPSVDGEE